MAKALKTIAIVAGVAALVVVTGGAAAGLGVSLGTTLIGTGISAGALLAGSALASTAAGLLAKGPKVPASQTDRLTASIDPRTFRKTVLGSTAFPIDVRYEEWSGADQEYCDWIVAHASHAVDGLDEIWLNTDLAWTAAGGVTPKFAGYFSVPNIVLEGSPANGFSFASGKWNGSARLTGCAYSRLRFKVTGNGKKATSPFSSGIPNRITIIGRGAKLYDPRRDSTVPGGSGPMRHDDQSTWRYTTDDGAVIGENLTLHALRVVLGWRIRNPVSGQMKLATGSGVPGRRLNLASWITAANLADERVNRSAGGTEPRYHGAGVISEGDDPQTPLDAICAACCGRFRDTGGKLSFSISHNDLAAAATDDGLLDDDVIGPFTWDPDPSLAGTPNVVRGRYVDATSASLYQLIDYPEVRLASPDGQDRIFPLDLGYVESPSHAQRVAKQVLQRKQYQREFTAPFDIRAWKYAVGDVVPFTFATLSFNRKLFRVKEQELGQGGICNMTLTVEHAAIYAFDRDDAAPVVAAQPNVYDATKNPLILAIEDASTTADWDGVTGVAKPADNATNSGDPNSPFGPGGTVGETINRLSEFDTALGIAKSRTDAIVQVTIPAVEKAVLDAGDRITDARERADKAQSDLGTETRRLDTRIDRAVAEGGYDDTDIYAYVGRVDRAYAAADLALGSRALTLEAAAIAGTGLAKNSRFAYWPDGQAMPTNWVTWAAQGSYRVERAIGRNGSPYGVRTLNDTGGVESGFYQVPYLTGAGKYVIEVSAECGGEGFSGAGVTLSGIPGLAIDFCGDADTKGFIGDAANSRRSWSKMVDIADYSTVNLHAMLGWTGFGRTIVPKSVWWWGLDLRPATDGEIKAGKADAALNNPSGALARIKANEDTLADLPNRYAAAQSLRTLEAQVNFAADSGLLRTVNARIEDRATAIADSKAGAVAQTVSTLRSEYDITYGQVQQQAGAITGINNRTSVYWQVTGTTPDGSAVVRLSKSDGSRGIFYIGADLLVDGNAVINGTIYTKAIANGAITNNVASRGGPARIDQNSGGSTELTSVGLNASGTGFVRIDFQTDFTYQEFNGGSQGCYLTVTRMRGGVAELEVLRQDVFGYQLLGFALDDPGPGPISYLLRAVEKGGSSSGGNYAYDFSYSRLAAMEFKK